MKERKRTWIEWPEIIPQGRRRQLRNGEGSLRRATVWNVVPVGTVPGRSPVGHHARRLIAARHAWDYFPHDQARPRAYRWGQDGLLGISDDQGRLCFALALWNERDPILKERLFGLTGPEGNHGEDAKESYYYLDSTPNHSYIKALYKYPPSAFP